MYRFATSSGQAAFRSHAPLTNDEIAHFIGLESKALAHFYTCQGGAQ